MMFEFAGSGFTLRDSARFLWAGLIAGAENDPHGNLRRPTCQPVIPRLEGYRRSFFRFETGPNPIPSVR